MGLVWGASASRSDLQKNITTPSSRPRNHTRVSPAGGVKIFTAEIGQNTGSCNFPYVVRFGIAYAGGADRSAIISIGWTAGSSMAPDQAVAAAPPKDHERVRQRSSARKALHGHVLAGESLRGIGGSLTRRGLGGTGPASAHLSGLVDGVLQVEPRVGLRVMRRFVLAPYALVPGFR